MPTVKEQLPVYLYPGKVRDWLRERVHNDKQLSRDLASGKWVKVSHCYHQLCDEVLDQFKPHICEWTDVKHFEQLVLDYIDPRRFNIAKPQSPDATWPTFDPAKFREGEFYID